MPLLALSVWETWARCMPSVSVMPDGGKYSPSRCSLRSPATFQQSLKGKLIFHLVYPQFPSSPMMTWVHLARAWSNGWLPRHSGRWLNRWAVDDVNISLPYFFLVWESFMKALHFVLSHSTTAHMNMTLTKCFRQVLWYAHQSFLQYLIEPQFLILTFVSLKPKRINACDRPENYESLKQEFASQVRPPPGQ